MIPPSGDSNEAVQAYFRWLWEQYLNEIPVPRVTVSGKNPSVIYAAGFALVSFFVLFSFFLYYAHRKTGDLYGVTSYAGNILERMGPVSIFSLFVFLYIFLWALYFPIVQIIFGQVY